ncbi:hypothetical protein AB0L42_00090 [Streptomyces sp. NPDC052287]
MGPPPDLKAITEGTVRAPMGLVDTVMVGTRDTARYVARKCSALRS